MKKHFLFAAAAAALMTCACSVEPVDTVDVQSEEEGEITVLTAGFAGSDETRTVRQPDGKVFWSPKDAISIIRGTSSTGNKKFVSDNTEPAASANFTGTMPSGTGAYWAVYPYRSESYFNGSYLVTTLPSVQEAVAGSFADDLFISAAYVSNSTKSLTFHHQVGGLKFSVTQPGIKRVTMIAADEDAFLAGLIGLYCPTVGQVPYIRATGYPEDMSTSIELTAPEGKTLQVGEAYHIVTMPSTLNGGFTLLFEKEDGSIGFKTISKTVALKAGHFATLMEADKGVTYRDSYLEYGPQEVTVEGAGGVFGITVNGTLEYHIDSASDWIKEVSAKGDVRFGCVHSFYAEPNPEAGERTGMLSICYGDNCYPIMVTQSAQGAVTAIPHHIFGMRFTATWCQYCPMMDEAFHKIKSQLGDSFEYACFYATSGNYGTAGSDYLADFYGIGGYPTGIIDGRVDIPNYNSTDVTAQEAINAGNETVKYYPTATSLGIESSVSGRNVTVKVDVKALYAEDYKLTVLLCENDIIGKQSNYTSPSTITDFNHSRVTRMFLTSSYTGDLFEVPADGGTTSLTYTATIPSGYNMDNMEVVAYVQRSYGDRPAIQSGRYGEWYVDNSRSAAFGKKVEVEF